MGMRVADVLVVTALLEVVAVQARLAKLVRQATLEGQVAMGLRGLTALPMLEVVEELVRQHKARVGLVEAARQWGAATELRVLLTEVVEVVQPGQLRAARVGLAL